MRGAGRGQWVMAGLWGCGDSVALISGHMPGGQVGAFGADLRVVGEFHAERTDRRQGQVVAPGRDGGVHLLRLGPIAEEPDDAGFLETLPSITIINHLGDVSDQAFHTKTHGAEHAAGMIGRGQCNQAGEFMNTVEGAQMPVRYETGSHQICQRISLTAASSRAPAFGGKNGTGRVGSGTAETMGGVDTLFVINVLGGEAQIELGAVQMMSSSTHRGA